MTKIEGLRQNAENSQKAIKHLETRLNGKNSGLELNLTINFLDA
jgi:hypothetical protein